MWQPTIDQGALTLAAWLSLESSPFSLAGCLMDSLRCGIAAVAVGADERAAESPGHDVTGQPAAA